LTGDDFLTRPKVRKKGIVKFLDNLVRSEKDKKQENPSESTKVNKEGNK
jgi:hypothetical protein